MHHLGRVHSLHLLARVAPSQTQPLMSDSWAVNEDDEVISPVATLKLHLLNRTVTLSAATVFQDYLNTTDVNTGTLMVTQFTVLK